MNLTETVIGGTIQPDGTLVLDEKPRLPPGRVRVVVRTEVEIALPEDDPFWQRMQAIWAIPIGVEARDGGERTLSQLRKDRDEWEDHQQAIEQLQEECRSLRKSTEERTP